MNKRIREAFDQVHADEELKKRTMEFLAQQTDGFGQRAGKGAGLNLRQNFRQNTQQNTQQYFQQKKVLPYRSMAAAAACLALVLLGTGGYGLYFIPTTSIDIEINPSVTLGINRFDKVVTMESHNEDGSVLLDSVNVKYADYTDAINEIITDESIAGYLAKNEIMEISVTGSDEKKSQEILLGVESCTNQHKNIQCYGGNSEMAAAARQSGLSLGKYQAYLELQKQTPDITAEDLQGKTMREICDMMDERNCGETADVPGKGRGNAGDNGSGKGRGKGSETGNGNAGKGSESSYHSGDRHGNNGGNGSRGGHKGGKNK